MAITQAEYDTWRGHTKDYTSIEGAAKGLGAEDPTRKGSSRGKLERLLRKYDGRLVFGRHDVDAHLLKHYEPAKQVFESRSLGSFAVNPEGMIDFAFTADPKNPENFAKNYLKIDPMAWTEVEPGKFEKNKLIELGNSDRERLIAHVHNAYYQLNELSDANKEAKDVRTMAAFIEKSAELLQNAVAQHHVIRGVHPDVANERAALIRETYETSHPHEADRMLRYTIKELEKDLDELIPEAQRAEYARSLLKSKAAIKNHPNYTQTSKDLYSIVG
ncbi:MAG: hypothetical protein AABY00_00690 [Nanoarchaeota archaeon]